MKAGRKISVAVAGLLAIGAAIAFFMPGFGQPSDRAARDAVQQNEMAGQPAVAGAGPVQADISVQPGIAASTTTVPGTTVQPAAAPSMEPGWKQFASAEVIESREGQPDADGLVERIRLVKADMKYPNIRIVEQVRAADPTGAPVSFTAAVADHMLVRVHDGLSEEKVNTIASQHGFTVLKKMLAPDTYLIAFGDVSIDALPQALEAFNAEANAVQYAEPDYVVFASATTPNDPAFNQLWGMHQGTDKDIDAPEAWDLGQGSSNVVVAVIDTGIDYGHEDLAANMWRNPGEIPGNGIDDDGNGFIDDVYGWDFCNDDSDPYDDNSHGTHCAGTIGGVGNNGIGVAGVNWRVKLMAVKTMNQGGSGYISDAIDAVYYTTRRGVRLTSNSWGYYGWLQSMKDAIDNAGTSNILFVAAAGNEQNDNDTNPCYPSSFVSANIISVAATDAGDDLAWFSNYGKNAVDLGAPGVGIYSTVPTAQGKYASLSGTSMATPHVAGAAALIAAYSPTLTAAQIKQRILDNTDRSSTLSGKSVTGGRLNAYKGLSGTVPLEPPAAPLALGATPYSNRVELAWSDNATNETGYVIERRSGSSGFTTIATLVANTTSRTDTNVMGGVTYIYRAKATNAAGSSAYSPEASATVPGSADAWDPGNDVGAGAILLSPITTVEASHGPHTLSGTDQYDWFKANLVAGNSYNFNSIGGSGDTYAELFRDAAGTQLVLADDDGGGGLMFMLEFTADSTATYYIRVRTEPMGNNAAYNMKYSLVAAANQSPTVSLTSPASNAVYQAPGTIAIAATASDPDGSIAQVRFYNGATLLATDTSAPYTYSWGGVAAGNYTLTAVATDNSGLSVTSAPVPVVVNVQPTVTLTSPNNGSTFVVGSPIAIGAAAADTDGSISQVAFYSGATLLNTDTSSPFAFSWTNAALGSHALYAVATDNRGGVGTSATATISVVAPQPVLSVTPTNINIQVLAGQDAPAGSFTVANSGSGTMNYIISENIAWLSVSPTNGSSTGAANILTIAYATAGLETGSYTGTITVTAAGVKDSPSTIAVNLLVSSNSLDTDLIAHYPLNGDARNIIDPYYGGEVIGAISTNDRFGQANGALQFDGVNDAISTSNAVMWAYNNFSISLWLRPSVAHQIDAESTSGISGTNQRFAFMASNADYLPGGGRSYAGVGISAGTNGISVYEHTGYYFPAVLVYQVPILDWTHAVVVYNGNQPPILYINGRFADAGLVSGQEKCVGAYVQLTSDIYYGAYFGGGLDDIRVYNRALTSNEVWQLYGGGSASISGTISYAGAQTGQIVVVAGAYTNKIAVPGTYGISNLPAPGTYSVTAFRDVNGNNQRDASEPYGEYAGNPVNLTNNLSGVNVTLIDPVPSSLSISGNIDYGGSYTGSIVVTATSDSGGISTNWADDFESVTVSPYWTVTNWGGTGVAENRAGVGRSGGRAYAVGGNGSGNIFTFTHWRLPKVITKGRVTWWNYDPAAGSTVYYTHMGVLDVNSNGIAGCDLNDRGWGCNSNGTSACHFVPWVAGANLNWKLRTVGWHKYEVRINGNSVSLYIDDELAKTGTASNGIAQVYFGYHGYYCGTAAALFDDLTIVDEDAGTGLSRSVSIPVPGPYVLTNLLPNLNYTVTAYRDINGSGAKDSFEPQGSYSNNPIYLTNSVTNAHITLTEPDTDGDGLSDAYEIGYGRYRIVSGSFTWAQAKADAETQGGHLGTITSEAEWNSTKSIAQVNAPGLNPWLGGTDEEVEGVWKWITGEKWEYTRWVPGNPDNYNGDENYLQGYGELWNDLRGTDVLSKYLFEIGWYTSPTDSDTDDDGLHDGQEVNTTGTDPTRADTDGDGLNDGAEITAGTNPLDPDSDDDGLNDYYEVVTRPCLNPLNPDTDGDGIDDGAEVAGGSDPCSAESGITEIRGIVTYHGGRTGVVHVVAAGGSGSLSGLFVSTNGSDAVGSGIRSNPYGTIQKAIDVATNGQQIVVMPGTYSGAGNRDIDLKGKRLVIISEEGPERTIVDCGQTRIMRAISGEPIGTTIDGFTFRNGYIAWSGDWSVDSLVRIRNSSVTIRNCIFSANRTTAGYVTSTTSIIGPASNDSVPHEIRIENCLFYNNSIGGGGWTSVGGGGACVISAWDHGWASTSSVLRIDRCTIASNSLYSSVASWGSYGSGLLRAVDIHTNDLFRNAIIYGNTAPKVPSGGYGNNPAHIWGGTLSYSDISGGWRDGIVGSGLITNDPLFVAYQQGDYNLMPASPCVNSGDPASPQDPDGSRADMGYSYSLSQRNSSYQSEITWTGQVSSVYAIGGIVVPADYTVTAFLDCDGNGVLNDDEPRGSYPANPVFVTNRATNVNIELVVPSTGWTMRATHALAEYESPGTNTVECEVFFPTNQSLLGLGWTVSLPQGWALVSATGNGQPSANPATGEILFSGPKLTNNPIRFTYNVSVPSGQNGPKSISGTVDFFLSGVATWEVRMAEPNPLIVNSAIPYHSSDFRNPKWVIDLQECNRTLSYWRNGRYGVRPGTVDGYAPDETSQTGHRHKADYREPYWKLDGQEALRVIGYWMAGGYHQEASGADGYAPGMSTNGSLGIMDIGDISAMAVAPATYVPGHEITLRGSLSYSNDIVGLLWRPQLPDGWTIISVSANGGTPEVVDNEILFTTKLPPSPLEITYVCNVPGEMSGDALVQTDVQLMRQGTANPQSLFGMMAPNMLQLDTDGDGLPDWVETNTRVYVSPTDTGTDPNNPDTDGDGVRDGDEVPAGTNPNQAGDAFKILSFAQKTGDFIMAVGSPCEVKWSSVAGKTYSVFRTTNLLDGFLVLQSNVLATPPVNTYIDTLPPDPKASYSVGVE